MVSVPHVWGSTQSVCALALTAKQEGCIHCARLTHSLPYRSIQSRCILNITSSGIGVNPSLRMNTITHRALRYFWDPEPRNEDPSAMIWCLGQRYEAVIPKSSNNGAPENSSPKDPSNTWPTEFLDDFESRIWMTYRSDFTPIPRSPANKGLPFNSPAAALQYAGKLFSGQAGEGFSSDVGWGCMIRSAQSVLANALISLHLGRGLFPYNTSDCRMADKSGEAEYETCGNTVLVCRRP